MGLANVTMKSRGDINLHEAKQPNISEGSLQHTWRLLAAAAAKVIRKKCLDCSMFQRSEVDKCATIDCVLWPWRYGKSPEVAERQGKQTNPYELSGREYDNPDVPGGRDVYKEIEILLW